MKKNLLILTFFSLILFVGCGQSQSKETDDSSDSVTLEQEIDLADEAKEASKTAKDEAQKAEESINNLLEDF